MLKRIWAIISETDFYKFQKRARNENMDMGQALAALVHAYSNGCEKPSAQAKHHADHFNYLNEAETTHLSDVEV
jgi:hypothetical protein